MTPPPVTFDEASARREQQATTIATTSRHVSPVFLLLVAAGFQVLVGISLFIVAAFWYANEPGKEVADKIVTISGAIVLVLGVWQALGVWKHSDYMLFVHKVAWILIAIIVPIVGFSAYMINSFTTGTSYQTVNPLFNTGRKANHHQPGRVTLQKRKYNINTFLLLPRFFQRA